MGQLFGIICQAFLYLEIGSHIDDYELTLATYCGPQHRKNGVCLGPAWNLSYSGTLMFPPSVGDDGSSDFDYMISSGQPFRFDVNSVPPTFLVAIEPQPPHDEANWRCDFGPVAFGGQKGDWHRSSTGPGSVYKVITDRVNYFTRQSHQWTASMRLHSKYTDNTFVWVYVVDSRIKHLEDIHKQEQCSFEESWSNFNERHNGEHHLVLFYSRYCTLFFIIVSLCLVWVILHRFYFYVEGGKLLRRVIALKFFMQDIPQQMCIVAYLYAWYGRNGLRCQMCLFHLAHCDAEDPLHLTNALVVFFTVASACSNQILIQAKVRGSRYEEDECFKWLARFWLASLSILPFSTAVCVLSSGLRQVRSLLAYIVFGIPTLCGWSAFVCIPCFLCCDEGCLSTIV